MLKLFGTDGIIGRANQFPITPEIALWTGKAIAEVFSRPDGRKPRALIGKDTRLSGYMLETALTSGLVSMGMDVFEIGPMPTPAVAHLTRSMCADCGIMITASHNPAADNGIKIFDSEGYRLPEETEARIETEVLRMIRGEHPACGTGIGKAFRIDDARGRYIEFAKSTIRNRSLVGLRAVLDCANGAAYYIAPLIFNELGVELIRTATSPDGSNINANCGLVCPQNMLRLVREHRADIGISLDGDAERVIFADHKGNLVNGERILGLCALDYRKRERLAHNTVAVTELCSAGFLKAMREAGIKTEITPAGTGHVTDRMRALDLNLGSEGAGHFVFRDYATAGDGIIAALHVACLMKRENVSLCDLASGFMTDFPQASADIPVKENFSPEQIPEAENLIRQAEANLRDGGRVLVRRGDTENICRVLVEAPTKAEAEKWCLAIGDAIRKKRS